MKNRLVTLINFLIKKLKLKHISDGYHTHEELYKFRLLYNANLFNQLHERLEHYKNDLNIASNYHIHKSIRHHDGELCFGGGWFIVVAVLPTGQISNHYKMADWDLFKVPEVPKALFEFDGHSPKDVVNRLTDLCKC